MLIFGGVLFLIKGVWILRVILFLGTSALGDRLIPKQPAQPPHPELREIRGDLTNVGSTYSCLTALYSPGDILRVAMEKFL